MSWEKKNVFIKAHDLLADGLKQQGLFTISRGCPDSSTHQGIPGEKCMVDFIHHAVQTVPGNVDDLNIKTTKIEHFMVLYGGYWVFICRKPRSEDSRLVNLEECIQPCCVGSVSMGEQHILKFEFIGFNQIDQFNVYMAGIYQDGITSLFGPDKIGVAKSYDREVLINSQWRASS